MGLFNNIFHKNQPKSQETIAAMLAAADAALAKEEYSQAADTYKQILALEPNTTAQYNLGTLYALGKGVKHNYKEAAYWFHKAELGKDARAGQLCQKSMMDFIHQNCVFKTPEQLYTEVEQAVAYIFPETADVRLETCRKISGVAGLHFNKHDYPVAAKLFRAAAEFGNDGNSQNYLAVLYNAGLGLKKNDLAALYWFDRAADNGIEVSKKDRDGILGAYRSSCSPEEFHGLMQTLAGWCQTGTKEIPKDAKKAGYWQTK